MEFGQSRTGSTDRAAVVQFATAKFVVIIPLEALTEYKRCKPVERRGMNVRHQLRHARCIWYFANRPPQPDLTIVT